MRAVQELRKYTADIYVSVDQNHQRTTRSYIIHPDYEVVFLPAHRQARGPSLISFRGIVPYGPCEDT